MRTRQQRKKKQKGSVRGSGYIYTCTRMRWEGKQNDIGVVDQAAKNRPHWYGTPQPTRADPIPQPSGRAERQQLRGKLYGTVEVVTLTLLLWPSDQARFAYRSTAHQD